jgi:hypothetical protein
MSLPQFNPRNAVLFLFILVVAVLRVAFNFSEQMSPMSNFSPIGAMAIFGGAYFSKQWKGLSFPLLTLLISDLILQNTVFRAYGNGILYGGWYWVYGAFVLMAVAGRLINRKVTVRSFLLSVLVCLLIHWIVTDFGVWLHSRTYTQNFKGFVDCLVAAIPYELRFLTGTLIYGSILFGGFELLQNRYSALRKTVQA